MKETWRTDNAFIGFNIHSEISDDEIRLLKSVGVTHVRVGSNGPRRLTDFYPFLVGPPARAQGDLDSLLTRLELKGTDVVIALHRQLALDTIWEHIAKVCANRANVIGYDLINEPFD